jgi:hypothetical protein
MNRESSSAIVEQCETTIHLVFIKKLFQAVINFYIIWGASQEDNRHQAIDNKSGHPFFKFLAKVTS